MRVGRGNNVGGQTPLCWWADVIMLRNHYLTWFHIDQKFALFSHEGRSKDRFFKNTSHHNRRQTKTGLNAATPHLITKFFLEKFKKKMVDRHGGLKLQGSCWRKISVNKSKCTWNLNLLIFMNVRKSLQASLTSRWLLMRKSTIENYSGSYHGESNVRK